MPGPGTQVSKRNRERVRNVYRSEMRATAREKYLTFLLDRLSHDLSNSVGGILSLADHHLRTGLEDRESLDESLNLIYRSCEESRRLLLLIGELLQPINGDLELSRLSTLAKDVIEALKVVLPRSIQLRQSLGENDGGVLVNRALLMRTFVELASLTLPRERSKVGTISCETLVEGKTATFHYRSDIPASTELAREVQTLFAEILEPGQIGFPEGDGSFNLSLQFPLVEI